jgi:glycosyltransferase 2 family protein
VLLLDRFRHGLKNLHQEIYYFKRHKKVLIKNVLLSVLIQIISPITSYIIILSFGYEVSILYFFLFLPIIGAITLLPISIGGLGVRESLSVAFFANKAGLLTSDVAFAMSSLSFSFLIVYSLIGGLIYVFTLHHRRL